MNQFEINNGSFNEFSSRGCCRNSNVKLSVTDWLSDLPADVTENDIVEVQFKNTRKGYFVNIDHLPLDKGVWVAVEANPGHDIGEVTLTGKLVSKQIEKNHIDLTRYEIRRIYRLATDQDMQRRQEAKDKEQATMIRARQLAAALELSMKIGDVEYQGDGSKAIFYYIADERVDFRQLIKVYAETFRVRIEMKQIGARQEAGRIGGFGPCGRELCCSTWMGQFCSVGTNAARAQNLSPNPQKLAGLCAKLKCCLNYELDTYQDSISNMPSKDRQLETLNGTWYMFSINPLKKEITYSSAPGVPANLQVITIDRANEVIELNNRGEKPDSLGGVVMSGDMENTLDYENVVGQDDVTRFDKNRRSNRDRRNSEQRARNNRSPRR